MTSKRARFYRTHDQRSYILSDEDIEWLARALWGECGAVPTKKEAGAVAWTMFLRFFRWPGSRWSSFQKLIRAFSQPVNPLWIDPDGGKCLTYPQYCTPTHIARRRKITYTPWLEVPFSCKNFAWMFAAGFLDSPLSQDYVDFASTPKAVKYGYPIDGNYFLTVQNLRDYYNDSTNWIPGEVGVEKGVGPELPAFFRPTWGGWEYALLAAWGALLTWLGWTYFRRRGKRRGRRSRRP